MENGKREERGMLSFCEAKTTRSDASSDKRKLSKLLLTS
jgi:hypothetical protein